MQNGSRDQDGSAGDANYGVIGLRYAHFRRPDPRIAALIETALGDACNVLNVGAGAGSYEPVNRAVTAVEPSSAMRSQRSASLPAAIDATGRVLGTSSFPSTPAGCRGLLCWLRRHGWVVRVGVEGTGAYGAGLARYLTGEGVAVVRAAI